MRRRKNNLEFIDEKKFLSKWANHKTGNIVTYKRLSDETVSLGQIRWFELTKEDRVVVTVVDKFLENFQACYVEDIIDKPDAKTAKMIRRKRDKLDK